MKKTLGLWITGWVVLTPLSLACVAGFANVFRVLAHWDLARAIVAAGPGDDVHALLALQMAGSVEHLRVVLPGIGSFLADRWPEWFTTDPSVGAWLALEAGIGTSSFALLAAASASSVFLLSVGGVLRAASLQTKRSTTRLLGRRRLAHLALLVQAFGAGSQAAFALTDRTIPDVVWPMVTTKALGTTGWAGAPDFSWAAATLSVLVHLGVVGTGLLLGWGIGRLPWLLPAKGTGHRRWSWRWRARSSWATRPLAGVLLFSACAAAMPITPRVVTREPVVAQYDARRIAAANAQAARATGRATVVRVIKSADTYWLSVDGRRRVLRGVGYNPSTVAMPDDERLERLDHDFSQIRSSRFNAILGWNEAEFDAELLARAGAHDLGAVAPFDLPPSVDYADPETRAQLLQRITAWVNSLKDNPGLWMWGLGNEVIHGMGDARDVRAPAFAEFLIEAADTVHRLDPNHPVLYRDAEDVFLPPVAVVLDKGPQRPWFVYGMNFFSYRMDEALTKGPSARLNHPLLISEFGPAGVTPPARAAAYVKQWKTIRRHHSKVLGGFVYVWCQVGPEALDRLFGMTDAVGQPVDGSLAALTAAFSEEPLTDRPEPPQPGN